MKTQIIQINRSDDFISIRDKMTWGQTKRILLIWPAGQLIPNNPVEFNLLKRYAQRSGAQLGIVTTDAQVMELAARVDLPVFADLHAAQNAELETDQVQSISTRQRLGRTGLEKIRSQAHQRPSTWSERWVLKLIAFPASILAILLLGIFILPKAEIILSPEIKIQSMVFSLSTTSSAPGVMTQGVLPAELQYAIVEGEKTMQTTGFTIIPDQAAYGEIQFRNNSDLSITLPNQIIVQTSGDSPVQFAIQLNNQLTLEPGKSILLTATAVESGTSGNLPAATLVILKEPINEGLSVTNPAAMTGGTDAKVPSPSAADILLLEDSLVEQLDQAAAIELQAQLSTGDVLITPTIKMIDTIEKITSPGVGEPGKHVTLKLRLHYQASVVRQDTLKTTLNPILDAAITPGYVPVLNSTKLSAKPPAKGDNSAEIIMVKAERKLQAVLDTSSVLNQINGMTVSNAEKIIAASVPNVEAVQLRVFPRWWPWLPLLTMRMSLINP